MERDAEAQPYFDAVDRADMEIERLTALLRECEEVVGYGVYEGDNPQSFWENYPIQKAQALHLKLAGFKEKP